MKRLFTYAAAACFAISAAAQSPEWKAGDEITEQVGWKAYSAADEDMDAPAWQGYNYEYAKKTNGDTWEFRGLFDGGDPSSLQEVSWGVFNNHEDVNKPWTVYQDFTMPAGIYKVTVQGVYREGEADATFNLWKEGYKTKNCFVYAQVGDEEYASPMGYLFDEESKERLFEQGDWQRDGERDYKGEKIYFPTSHWGVDAYFANGFFDNNEVTFIVPEETTVRVGIKRTVPVAVDQVWWDNWKMFYVAPYNEETAKVFVAKQELDAVLEEVENYLYTISETYPAFYSVAYNTIGEISVDKLDDLEAINEAIAAVRATDELVKKSLHKLDNVPYIVSICESILRGTNYAGRPAFEKAVATAKSLYEADSYTDIETLEEVDAAIDNLYQARIDYLLTQEPAEDGSIDLSNALSAPWYVNPEYNPVYDPASNSYVFNDLVEPWMQGGEANGYINDDANLEEEHTNGENYLPAISDLARYSTNIKDENRWVFSTDWANWNDFPRNICKERKYPAFYSNWKSGAGDGGYGLHQVVTNLPDGFYTIEGRVIGSIEGVDNFAKQANQYIYVNDAEGNQLVKVNNYEGFFWWGGNYERSVWQVLKSDYFVISGGKATIGYRNNTMSCNSGVVLKYYGADMNYTTLVQNLINDNAPAFDGMWNGDLVKYDEMIKKATDMMPLNTVEAYNEAKAVVMEAIEYKNRATAAANSYDLPRKYSDLCYKYVDDEEENLDVMTYTMSIMDYVNPAWSYSDLLRYEEDASYLSIAPATEVYNAYDAYFAGAVDAVRNYNSEAMAQMISEHSEYLISNYASADTLNAFLIEISKEKNRQIFSDVCADASELNPVEITDLYIQNASFAEGPSKGWTQENANASINTYGRELAECWNHDPFTFSQTLPSMPAGKYELRVRALYRDRGGVDQDMIDRYNAGTYEDNLFLFANENEVAVKSICDNGAGGTGWVDPSFNKYYNYAGSDISSEIVNMGYRADWDGTLFITEDERTLIQAEWEQDPSRADDVASLLLQLPTELDPANSQYPFDSKVGENYYPSSMMGFHLFCKQHPEAYANSLTFTLAEDTTLRLGLNKKKAVGSDWAIFDDFQLFYLGADKTGITTIDAADAAPNAIYNVAGQKVSSLQKGVNIVNRNGKMIKILVK